MSCEESITLRVEDIGHLHGRCAHDWDGFRKRRDRRITGGGRHVQLLERIGRRVGYVGRPSIPPERLLRAQLLQVFYCDPQRAAVEKNLG